MRTVTTDDIKATVGVCPISGAVKKVVRNSDEENGTTKKFLAWVSDCAVHIHTETTRKTTENLCLQAWERLTRERLNSPYQQVHLLNIENLKRLASTRLEQRNRFGDLNFEMVQKITTHPKRMQRVEVPEWRENIPLLPGVDLVDKVEYRLSSKIPAAVYDGDLDKAKEILQKLLKVHKFAPILVATILGAPAIARWHKNDRFGLGLWGMTGTLKTTTALTAMGVYGIGYLDQS